jgi:ribosomal protein S20
MAKTTTILTPKKKAFSNNSKKKKNRRDVKSRTRTFAKEFYATYGDMMSKLSHE